MELDDPRQPIFGWGYDIAPENRPGVPKNRKPTQPVGHAHWGSPSMQQTERASLISPSKDLTPIYASTVPPRGVSGALRRAAYRLPEYRPRRWLMLLFADRVDVIEHNLPRAALALAGAGALFLGWLAVLRRATHGPS